MFFFHFLFVIASVLHAYVFWRMASVPWVVRHVSRRTLAAAGALLWTAYLAGQLLENSDRVLLFPLQLFAADWTGVLFLVFLCLLAADLATGFGYLFRRAGPGVRGWALVAGCALSAIAIFQGMRAPVVRDYEVRLAGLPADKDGTVIVVASDFHLGTLLGERWLKARVAQINAQRPDLVVLAGDIVEGHGGQQANVGAILRQLSAPRGVWAVNGNHDGYGRTGGRLLENAAIHVLHDSWAEAEPGLVLAGVDDLTSRRRRGGRDAEAVEQALAHRPAGATVFVSHTPWQAERAARQGAGLMLAAHTHNGQIWPFSYFVRLRYPLLGGRYEVGGMPVIVCRGTGTWGPRMRLWYPGEILRITLRAGPQSAISHQR